MATVRAIRYEGEGAVEVMTRQLRLVAVTSRGPRIAFLNRAKRDDNLLLWRPRKYRRGKWDLMGGHRFWLTRPGADEAEETYATDNAKCEVKIGRKGVVITAPPIAGQGVQRSLAVGVEGDDRVTVEHRVENVGDMLWSGGAWGLTCTRPTPSTSYIIPLSDGSTWDSASVTFFRRWGGTHTGRYDDPQFSFTADALVARSLGEENKRAIRAAPGIVALHDPERDVLFVKRAAYCRGAAYPLDANLALYTGADSFMVEMETMGPVVTLKPGETHVHLEEWVLRPTGERNIPTAQSLGAIVARHPGDVGDGVPCRARTARISDVS